MLFASNGAGGVDDTGISKLAKLCHGRLEQVGDGKKKQG